MVVDWRTGGRRRQVRLSDHAVSRILATLCVLLAVICCGLAFAYTRKAEEARCFAEAADLGLSPPNDCQRRR